MHKVAPIENRFSILVKFIEFEKWCFRRNKNHCKIFQQKNNTKNPNEMPLRLLSTEVSYVQSVLEETLEEVQDSGSYLALKESVAKSRERNKEKNEIG